MAIRAAFPSAPTAWLLGTIVLLACCPWGCSRPDESRPNHAGESVGERPEVPGQQGRTPESTDGSACGRAQPGCSEPGEPESCGERIPHFDGGQVVAELCPSQIAESGLTIVDLSDRWAPRILAGRAGSPVPYREVYRRLASEQLGEGPEWHRAEIDRYFELYGVSPSLAIVADRLADDARHHCHDAVPDEALGVLEEDLDTWRSLALQRSDLGHARMLEKKLEDAARARRLGSVDELARDPEWRDSLRVIRRIRRRHQAIEELQAHLRCERLLGSGAREGLLDEATIAAMQTYHRRHMIVSWQLDDETRRALLADSRELDFRTLLRSLRERLVDATGVIEDGSARGQPAPVLGRQIDPSVFRADPLARVSLAEGPSPAEAADPATPSIVGAPDWIAAATDVAARALGWWAPEAARAFFQRGSVPPRVALALPAVPSYHDDHMSLRIEIDRGDVWYEFPFLPGGDRRLQPRERRPSVAVIAKHQGQDLALVRWPTTIGGWQPERVAAGVPVKLAYKESPAGQRIWRDVVATPIWIPPPSTPSRDLWRPRRHGRWALKHDTFGPGYASAYGLVMMINHREDRDEQGGVKLTDTGVRTHGSVSYASILDGYSHGCHRLHNHRAVRLAGFLLAHRKHVVRGPLELDYHRTFRFRRLSETVHFQSRGYRYQLTPPVLVDVTEGRIRGRARHVQLPQPATRPMLKRYR